MMNIVMNDRLRASHGRLELLLGTATSILLAGCFTFGSNATGQSMGTGGEADDGGGDALDETGPVFPEPEPFEHRVFIAQHLEYDNKEEGIPTYQVAEACVNSDVPDDTMMMAIDMDMDNWVVRYAHDREREPGAPLHARPDSWVESYPAAPFDEHYDLPLDDMDGDAYDLAVYSGHGSPGIFGTNFDAEAVPFDDCRVNFEYDVRLGAYCGQKAKVAAYSASCVAGFDEGLCPPPPDDPAQAEFWVPWSDFCWQPLYCSVLRSSLNQTLAFVDSPFVSVDQQQVWYENAKVLNAPGPAWINTHAVDELSGQANQPTVIALAESVPGLTDHIYLSDINSGLNLEQMLPTVPRVAGIIWMTWDGHSFIYDADGNEVLWGIQEPESNPVCIPDHFEPCDDEQAIPEGVSPDDCPPDGGA